MLGSKIYRRRLIKYHYIATYRILMFYIFIVHKLLFATWKDKSWLALLLLLLYIDFVLLFVLFVCCCIYWSESFKEKEIFCNAIFLPIDFFPLYSYGMINYDWFYFYYCYKRILQGVVGTVLFGEIRLSHLYCYKRMSLILW